MVQLQTFLGCFRLRSGCLFIGYCGAIFGFLLVILSAVGIFITAMRENTVTGDNKIINEVLMGVCIYLLIICAVSFALHVILLVGLYEKRLRLLNIFLVCMTTYLVITFVMALIVTVHEPSRGFSYIISFAINVYYLLVIRSYKRELEGISQPMVYSKA